MMTGCPLLVGRTPVPGGNALCEPEFVALEEDWEGALKHGIYHESRQLGVDESVMWGEYFFVETLTRAVQS